MTNPESLWIIFEILNGRRFIKEYAIFEEESLAKEHLKYLQAMGTADEYELVQYDLSVKEKSE